MRATAAHAAATGGRLRRGAGRRAARVAGGTGRTGWHQPGEDSEEEGDALVRLRARRRRAEGGAEAVRAGYAVGVGFCVGRSSAFEEQPVLRRDGFDELAHSLCCLVSW